MSTAGNEHDHEHEHVFGDRGTLPGTGTAAREPEPEPVTAQPIRAGRWVHPLVRIARTVQTPPDAAPFEAAP